MRRPEPPPEGGGRWPASSELVEALQRADRRFWRLVRGLGIMVASGIILAAPIGWNVASRSPAQARVPAPLPNEGHRQALESLAAQATQYEQQGYFYPAQTVWQCYARVAKRREDQEWGAQQSELMMARIRHDAPPTQVATKGRVTGAIGQQPKRPPE